MLELRHYFATRPQQVCTVIVQNERGHVMLVRHSYRWPEHWMLPSGRMGRRENPVVTAGRELKEEVDCSLENGKLVELEDTAALEDALRDHRFQTYLVAGSTRFVPTPDLREIDEAAFFPLSGLPEPIDALSQLRLSRWILRNSFSIPVPAFVRPEYLLKRHRDGSLSETGSTALRFS